MSETVNNTVETPAKSAFKLNVKQKNWLISAHVASGAKWVLTVSAIVFGTFWVGPWINAMTSISAAERLQALQNPLYMFDNQGIIWGGLAINISLLAIIAVSLLKPWGRRLSGKIKKSAG